MEYRFVKTVQKRWESKVNVIETSKVDEILDALDEALMMPCEIKLTIKEE